MSITAKSCVRPAEEQDLLSLIELARRSWLSAFSQTAPLELVTWWATHDAMTPYFRRHWQDMLVFDDEGVVEGVIEPSGGEIKSLWVHPRAHGSGVGSVLLRVAESKIRDRGFHQANLVCSGFNTKAYSFYLSQGYDEVGRAIEEHETGCAVEDIEMARRLN